MSKNVLSGDIFSLSSNSYPDSVVNYYPVKNVDLSNAGNVSNNFDFININARTQTSELVNFFQITKLAVGNNWQDDDINSPIYNGVSLSAYPLGTEIYYGDLVQITVVPINPSKMDYGILGLELDPGKNQDKGQNAGYFPNTQNGYYCSFVPGTCNINCSYNMGVCVNDDQAGINPSVFIFIPVKPSDGTGFFCTSNIRSYVPSSGNQNDCCGLSPAPANCPVPSSPQTNLTYGSGVFFQTLFDQTCGYIQRNQYLCMGTANAYVVLTFDTIANAYPNSDDNSFDYEFQLQHYMSPTNNGPNGYSCPNFEYTGISTGSIVTSGMVVTIFCQGVNGDQVVYANGNLSFVEQTSPEIGMGNVFLIKKVRSGTNEYVLSTDSDATINVGDNFVLYCQNSVGQEGLVGITENLTEGGSGFNNIALYTKRQVYDINNGCGQLGSYYCLWRFVDSSTGSGAINGTSAEQNTPVTFGGTYFIENVGFNQCTGSKQLETLGLGQSCFWSAVAGLSTNTPNLNFSILSDAYPGQNTDDNVSDVNSYIFFLRTSGGQFLCSTEGCDINNCVNCNTTNNKATSCGCATPWSLGKYLSEFFGWVVIFIVVVIIFVVLVVIVAIIAKIGSNHSKKKKQEKLAKDTFGIQ